MPEALITSPHVIYVHPEFGAQVDLVGMIHIAQPAYYEQIQSVVGDRDADAAVIHYERVMQDGPEARKQASRSTLLKANLTHTM